MGGVDPHFEKCSCSVVSPRNASSNYILGEIRPLPFHAPPKKPSIFIKVIKMLYLEVSGEKHSFFIERGFSSTKKRHSPFSPGIFRWNASLG